VNQQWLRDGSSLPARRCGSGSSSTRGGSDSGAVVVAGTGQTQPVPARGGAPGRWLSRSADALSDRGSVRSDRLARREDGVIERIQGMVEVEPEKDLAVRAARVLQRHTRTSLGANLHVIKHIPAGGGLGGGSSDAATVLLALNRLWNTGLGLPELAALGLSLGADVPLFVHGASAWGEGRGERLTPLSAPPRWFLIVHPGVSVSTAEIFQAPELTRNSSLITCAPQRLDRPATTANRWCVDGIAKWRRARLAGYATRTA